MGRIIIFTGKGGVGKTSIASAHSVKAAQEGMKTLIVSTDMAHNLGDIFNMDIKNEPVQIMDKLWGLEIDPNYEMERYYGTIQESLKHLMKFSDEKDAEAYEDIVAFPGMEELFSLLKIKELYDKNIYDLIIVDCAPTGETLSLLKFPELFSWYMEKIFPVGKVAMKLLRPISKVTFKGELPDSEAMTDIEKLYVKLYKLQTMLKDREISSIRLVTIPEKMIVNETKRNYMYMNLFGFNVDALYINRLIPDDIDNDFFSKWKEIQQKYKDELNSVFSTIPIYKIKWYETEIGGIDALKRIVDDSLSDKNIFKVLRTAPDEEYEKTERGYKLSLSIPIVSKTDFDMYESETDIIIKIGNFKRNIPIPDVLRKYSITKANLDNGILSILFEK